MTTPTKVKMGRNVDKCREATMNMCDYMVDAPWEMKMLKYYDLEKELLFKTLTFILPNLLEGQMGITPIILGYLDYATAHLCEYCGKLFYIAMPQWKGRYYPKCHYCKRVCTMRCFPWISTWSRCVRMSEVYGLQDLEHTFEDIIQHVFNIRHYPFEYSDAISITYNTTTYERRFETKEKKNQKRLRSS
jgi:hypothetical protein